MAESPVLTVIIPVFNEVGTIAQVLDAVDRSRFSRQIVVVDDGSSDGSAAVVQAWMSNSGRDSRCELLRHPSNRGKGSAIRTALGRAEGRFVLIQDADLECDPADYPLLLEPLLRGEADIVLGSRYLRPRGVAGLPLNRLFVILANLAVLALFFRRITDEAGCYKVMATDLLRSLDLRCCRFEFCPEVVAKCCLLDLKFREVQVRYTPRTVHEGKKIRFRDAVQAIATLVRWRMAGIRHLRPPRRSIDRGNV